MLESFRGIWRPARHLRGLHPARFCREARSPVKDGAQCATPATVRGGWWNRLPSFSHNLRQVAAEGIARLAAGLGVVRLKMKDVGRVEGRQGARAQRTVAPLTAILRQTKFGTEQCPGAGGAETYESRRPDDGQFLQQ